MGDEWEGFLELDDVVITARSVPGFGQVTIAGVVTARHEGASFGSDVFLTIDGVPGRAATSCRKVLSELSTPQRSTACRYASACWFYERLFDLRVGRLQATTNARIPE